MRSFCASKQNSVGAQHIASTTRYILKFEYLQRTPKKKGSRAMEQAVDEYYPTTPTREETTKHSLVGKPGGPLGIFLLFLSGVLSV